MPELLRIENLHKEYMVRRGAFRRVAGTVHAVDGVSLDVEERSTFGLLGESGSGKSTLGRLVLALEKPTSGRISFRGRDVNELSGDELKAWRRQVQVVFQDPYSALPPRMRVGRILEEPLRIHGHRAQDGYASRAAELLAQVGLPERFAGRYPHQLSGGQRERVVIARALAVDPDLVVCDEPVSALDVSVQAHILNLLQSLQERLGLTYLFVSHDLGVVRHVADEIGVMYLGSIVERGPAEAVYRNALHPYTRALLAAIPSVRRGQKSWTEDRGGGEPPSALGVPTGCKYRTRCPLATDTCRRERPPLREVAPRRWSACHYAEEVPERLGAGGG